MNNQSDTKTPVLVVPFNFSFTFLNGNFFAFDFFISQQNKKLQKYFLLFGGWMVFTEHGEILIIKK